MSKKKLQRFAEMETFTNVLQPRFDEVFGKDHPLKGKWKRDYFGNDHPLTLELGCGKGEYTLGLASRFAERNYIGIDIKGARIWKGAGRALREQMHHVAFIRSHIEMTGSFFGPSEVDEIWLTFPDPQLKKERKRLTSPRFLNLYRSYLRHNGRVHLKTDNELLSRYTLDLAIYNDCRILNQTGDLYHSGIRDDILEIRTFYEQQFLDQGMKIHYLCFELSREKEIIEPENI